jgi:hypothetical protein
MRSFLATFFTPQDREGQPVQVSLWTNELEIRLLQQSAGVIRWDVKRILPLEDTTVPFI